MSSVPVTLVGGTTGLPSGLQPRITGPGLDTHKMLTARGFNFVPFSFQAIFLAYSHKGKICLPGTKQKSGVDGGYPAELAVRCDKLMANLTRRCCQAGRGGSCSTRDSLSLLRTLMWHGNLFQASVRQCLRALISPER